MLFLAPVLSITRKNEPKCIYAQLNSLHVEKIITFAHARQTYMRKVLYVKVVTSIKKIIQQNKIKTQCKTQFWLLLVSPVFIV